jgi:hypothetical protein
MEQLVQLVLLEHKVFRVSRATLVILVQLVHKVFKVTLAHKV